MAEYVVKGAEKNETVLHTRTPNGYEEWRWLPVREEIVRCRDCKHRHRVRSWAGTDVDECWLHASPETGALGKVLTDPDGFCAWGERKEVGA